MIESTVFTEQARACMRPWLFPIAKTLYEIALEQGDDIGVASIARLANPRDCYVLSTAEQLHQMKNEIQQSDHAETYLQSFRQYFQAQNIDLEGF